MGRGVTTRVHAIVKLDRAEVCQSLHGINYLTLPHKISKSLFVFEIPELGLNVSMR